MNPNRTHEVKDASGKTVKVLHRGDHESTRFWFLRKQAADKAARA